MYTLHPAKNLFRPVLLALLAALLLALPGVAAAQDSAPGTIDVAASTAEIDFPYAVTFALDASSSEAEITEVELLYGATRSDALTVVPVEARPGQSIQVEHVLDTQIFHLPVGVEITYRWIVRDAAGNQFESEPQQFVYEDDRFAWQQRSERGVTVYWYEGGESFGDELINTSTRALERIEQEIGATVEDPVKIYIYANTQDMRSALQTNSVEWVGGQANPGLGLIIGAVAPGDVDEVRRIVPHELSHQVVHQVIENPYANIPLWFDEGMAVHNQETIDTFFPLIVDEAARTGQLIPLEALAASFPTDPDRAYLSYAQSSSVINYIIDTHGPEKIEQLVAAFNEPLDVEQAIPQVFGMTIDELDAAWRETLPPAEVTTELEGSRSFAPPSRFEGDPVLPSSGAAIPPASSTVAMPEPVVIATTEPPEVAAPPPALIPGLALPMWGQLVLFSGMCLGGIVLTGVVLVVALRMVKSGES
jgi:hypothetical protein